MTAPETCTRPFGWIIAAAAAAAAVFVLDLLTPLGLAVPMLYVLPILLTWLIPSGRNTVFITASTLVLTWAGTVLSPGEITSQSVTNRVMATALLLVVAWQVIRHKRLVLQGDLVHEALRKSELRYRTIFHEAGVGVAQIDSRTGQFMKVNRKYCEIVGLTEDEMLETTFMSITHPDDLAEDLGFMERVRSGELSAFTMEKRYMKKDGSIVWAILNVAPLWQAGEMPSQHIAVVQDITARKQVEMALRESEERFRHIFQYAGTGIAIIDLNGSFVRCNPAYCSMIGYTEEELTRIAFPLLIHPDDQEVNQQAVEELLKNKQSFEVENRYIHKAGHSVWVHKFVSMLYGKDGEPTHLISLVTDITARKRDEEVLRELNTTLEQRVKERTAALVEANERWDWVVRATNDGVWDWDLVHDTVYFSPRWKEMHGFRDSHQSEPTKEWLARIHPEDRHRVLEQFESYLAGKQSQFWDEYRIQRKDGTYFWVLDRGTAVFDDQGRAVRMVGAETDITWRKETEEATRRREHEFHTLADNVPAFFSYVDRDRRYRFVNKRYEELFHRPANQFVGSTVQDLLGPDGYAVVQPYLDAAFGGEEVSFEYQLPRRDGREQWFSARYMPERDEQGRIVGLFILLADVTLLKLSESELREKERQLRTLSVRLLQAQEEERRRIAQELHDDVTQRLAALAIDARAVQRDVPGTEPSIVSRLQQLGDAAERLATDIQSMAHRLHPSILEHVGLEAAVREQVEEFASRTELKADIIVRKLPPAVPREQGLCLYRVLQESLRNVQKHADATHALVRLLGTRKGIGICVYDDGRGFKETEGATNRKGLGLTSMEERVRALQGTFRLRTKPGDGTEIHAWVPLEDVKGEMENAKRNA